MIDGETRLMGVIGEGIAYTKSPAMHNAAAAKLGINIAYLPLSMAAAQVPAFLEMAWHLGAVGFNVTTPHKELVAKTVGSKLASVNTLYRGKTGWESASTDGEGFAKGLARIDKTLGSFSEVVVLGAGGAVVALLAHWREAVSKFPKVTVLRRRSGGQASPRLMAGVKTQDLSIEALTKALAGKGPETLLIQGTSAPQKGDDLGEYVPALAGYGGAVVDLVYGKPSALYFHAISRDLEALDGEAMLIEQARLSQRLWWGKSATYEDLAAALRGK